MNKINFNLIFKEDGSIVLENPTTREEYPIADDKDAFFDYYRQSHVGNNFVVAFQKVVKQEKHKGIKSKYADKRMQPKNRKELEECINYLMEASSDEDVIDLNAIDTSLITDMSRLFSSYYASSDYFVDRSHKNIDISNWDVSNVRNMQAMFYNNDAFNGDLSNWDVSNVTDMSDMFKNSSFNNDSLKNWDVSNVEDFRFMFELSKFEGDLSNWRLGFNISSELQSGTFMMFYGCPFKGDITHWVDNIPKGKYYGGLRGMFDGSAFGKENDPNNTIPQWYYKLLKKKRPMKESTGNKTNKFIEKIQERNQFSKDLKKLL